MSAEVEIWWISAPAPAAIGMAVERFGVLAELPGGSLRLVEGDEDPREGVPFVLDEHVDPPEAVRALLPDARAVLRASAVLTGSRGFWMSRVAAQIQRRLGGVVFIPGAGEAFPDAISFEASWPAEHAGHGDHD